LKVLQEGNVAYLVYLEEVQPLWCLKKKRRVHDLGLHTASYQYEGYGMPIGGFIAERCIEEPADYVAVAQGDVLRCLHRQADRGAASESACQACQPNIGIPVVIGDYAVPGHSHSPARVKPVTGRHRCDSGHAYLVIMGMPVSFNLSLPVGLVAVSRYKSLIWPGNHLNPCRPCPGLPRTFPRLPMIGGGCR